MLHKVADCEYLGSYRKISKKVSKNANQQDKLIKKIKKREKIAKNEYLLENGFGKEA